MKNKVTINDIAKMCQVSKSSVSRYLNQGYVSKENAEKIKKAIEETGFQTNFFASRLKSQRSQLIGIILPSMDRPEIGKMLNGVSKILMEHQYQGIIMVSGNQIIKERECINLLAQQGADALLLAGVEDVEIHRDQLTNLKLPVLFANQICSYADTYSLDEEKAGRILAEHLLKRKLTRLVYMKSAPHPFETRKQAILEYYMEQKSSCDLMVAEVREEYADMYEQAKIILEKKPEAIICDHDDMAFCILKYFKQYHIRVPQDVSVISFGGSSLGEMCLPALTSISFPYEVFGEQLAQKLIAKIEEKDMPEFEQDIRIMKRSSVKEKDE